MAETSLLDLPDELIRVCMAGAGGQGVAICACCSQRLQLIASGLFQQPIFSSGCSTCNNLEDAIRDATHRAMAGSFGAVDFALLFVANFGLPKKYTDPSDTTHAVEMLRTVLGKDVPIVGCACSGLMGIGPDSCPVEVDPSCSKTLGRRAMRWAAQHGRPVPPTRGVTVLLGRMPPGCAVRGFAAATEPSAGPGASWPEFEDAIALTSSQRTKLAAQLAAAAASKAFTTRACSDSSAGTNSREMAPAAATAAAIDGSASPATAAAATSLLSVAAGPSSTAAAAAAAANSAGRGVSGYGDASAELVPQLCLLLYRSTHHGSDELQSTLEWMRARYPGMQVVGGASSGAGDLLFSPGAVSRLAGDAPHAPAFVGLLVSSARASASIPAAALPVATAPLPPPPSNSILAAGLADSGLAAAVPAAVTAASSSIVSSAGALSVAAMSSHGMAPLPGFAVYTDLAATAVPMGMDCFQLSISSATKVPGSATAAGAASTAAAAAAGDTGGSSSAGAGSSSPPEPHAGPGVAADGEAAAEPAGAPLRRSARVQQQSASEAAAAAAAAPVSGVALLAKELDDAIEQDLEHGVCAALWRCPAGVVPGPFTGLEDQMVMLGLFDQNISPSNGILQLSIFEVDNEEQDEARSPALLHLLSQGQQGSRLCMQFVTHTGQASANLISHGLAHLKHQLHAPAAGAPTAAVALLTNSAVAPATTLAAATAAAAAAAAGSSLAAPAGIAGGLADCYAAVAACAAAAGARSGRQALAVFSCTMRGQAIYAQPVRQGDSADCLGAFGAVCEAGLVDAAFEQRMPFVGVYVDGELGPAVKQGCLGWGDPQLQRSQPQAFTSMFAAFGCQDV